MRVCIKKEVVIDDIINASEYIYICNYNGISYSIEVCLSCNIQNNQKTGTFTVYMDDGTDKIDGSDCKQLGVPQNSFIKAVNLIRKKIHSNPALNLKIPQRFKNVNNNKISNKKHHEKRSTTNTKNQNL
jgi:hypothetical protein